jgi:predicted transcriptional regulator
LYAFSSGHISNKTPLRTKTVEKVLVYVINKSFETRKRERRNTGYEKCYSEKLMHKNSFYNGVRTRKKQN